MEPGDEATDMCLDRYLFDESVWSYGLYNSDGSRVNRDSGFSVKTDVGDHYGWIGYWGLWLPDNVTVNDGETIYKIKYGSGAPEEFPTRS